MKIVPIFGEHLKAIKYPENKKNEFARLFELWQDLEYLEEFFENNKDDLTSGFWGDVEIIAAIFETFDYAKYLEDKILAFAEMSNDDSKHELDEIFKPLHDSQTQIIHLNHSKAKHYWLRIYALRIESNVYLITGGAIKLTRAMQDREHTNRELEKLAAVRNYLISLGIDSNSINSLEI